MTPHEAHNKAVPVALGILIKASEGDFANLMVMYESFQVGMLDAIIRTCPTSPTKAVEVAEIVLDQAIIRLQKQVNK
jgi:hypothetical protein